MPGRAPPPTEPHHDWPCRANAPRQPPAPWKARLPGRDAHLRPRPERQPVVCFCAAPWWVFTPPLTTRHQFGRPPSSFQALQHRLVQMFITLDEARALVMAAAMAASERLGSADHLAQAAWQKVEESGQKIAEEAIQMHGGIGMTEECFVGRYVRRILHNAPLV
ncbi:acyl-CoA dehydrogenase family protein [Paracoccus jeotgali]|uniref:acyl-CoA dehydrogenase family protein n=1 Tax=Paracoccus jeotgali TaxID=2065379 RepID=UPI00298F3A87|nr:acyl-CoA dehydrogenase family protein [Paracoccus jeotgali]